MILDIKNYPGSKAVSGFKQQFFNILPKAEFYIDAMCGSGYVGQQIKNHIPDTWKAKTHRVWFNDLSSDVVEQLRYQAIDSLSSIQLYNKNYSEIFDFYNMCNSDAHSAVFYFDPPYHFDARKGKRKIYQHEWTNLQHLDFLKWIVEKSSQERRAKIFYMISHYPHHDYDFLVDKHGWQKIEFEVMTRNGAATEAIYFNFDPLNTELLTYEYIGKNHTDRQRIKRYQKNFLGKINRLPNQEKKAMLQLIKEEFFN